jgi:hypothetical protein
MGDNRENAGVRAADPWYHKPLTAAGSIAIGAGRTVTFDSPSVLAVIDQPYSDNTHVAADPHLGG